MFRRNAHIVHTHRQVELIRYQKRMGPIAEYSNMAEAGCQFQQTQARYIFFFQIIIIINYCSRC